MTSTPTPSGRRDRRPQNAGTHALYFGESLLVLVIGFGALTVQLGRLQERLKNLEEHLNPLNLSEYSFAHAALRHLEDLGSDLNPFPSITMDSASAPTPRCKSEHRLASLKPWVAIATWYRQMACYHARHLAAVTGLGACVSALAASRTCWSLRLPLDASQKTIS